MMWALAAAVLALTARADLERGPVDWQVLSAGRDVGALRLIYEYGGCQRGDGRATVRETPSQIHIAVDVSEVVAVDGPDPRPVCPQVLNTATLRVRLRRPVGGRPILGDAPVLGGEAQRVPRVIDLAFADARAALRVQGFHVRRFGQRRGRVVFQSPRPGAPAGDRRVGLTLGRHAFDARALKRCVEAVGLRVAAGRPEFGDEDAPDLELVVTGLYFPGYVALYAGPARARENAPGIRHRVRAVGCVAGARP